MPHVITQNCCNDASCVAVCPVDCIHPRPDEPDFATAEMLYIDPDACIDCGACIPACPVDAIVPDYDDELPAGFETFERLNADYYTDGAEPLPAPAPPPSAADDLPNGLLRVAIVGSGPAGWYAAEEIQSLLGDRAEVHMYERLCTPGGLVRFGVAPDHQKTKIIQKRFDRAARHPAFRLHLNVEIGRDLSHEDLARHHHAVVYASGAMHDRALGIPGEPLRGSHSAAEFVAWYNGHPDYRHLEFDLSGERAVVLGNGNVAFDVARILLRDPDDLARTDIADHALEALRRSSIREVVVVGRRGPVEAAFTTPELVGMLRTEGITVRADAPDVEAARDSLDLEPGGSPRRTVMRLLESVASAPAVGDRTVTFRFRSTPVEILGRDHVEGVRLRRNDLVREGDTVTAVPTTETTDLACGMVIRAVGYTGTEVPGLPFDQMRGTLHNDAGRVVDPFTDEPLPGVYTCGWIKRGPSGGIGANRECARQTVRELLTDWREGRLAEPTAEPLDVRSAVPESFGLKEFRAIDAAEVGAGKPGRRPRVKLVDPADLLAVARGGRPTTV